MGLLDDILAQVDNAKRVAGKNTKDFIANPKDFLSMVTGRVSEQNKKLASGDPEILNEIMGNAIPGGALGATKFVNTRKGLPLRLELNEEEGILDAFNAKGKVVGSVEIAPLKGYTLDKQTPSQSAHMQVLEGEQRQGINTAMQEYLMQEYPNYTPIANTLTDDGTAWASAASKEMQNRNSQVLDLLKLLRGNP